ncbi:NADP-dependent oxidoreductase domain-containing protein, partial [Coniella lustricola]
LTHFVASIPKANARWTAGDALDRVLDKFSGDIVQAVQALKESKPARTPELLGALQALRASFSACAEYCSPATASSASATSLKFPFTRADRQVRDVLGFLYPDLVGALPPTVTGRRSGADGGIQIDVAKMQNVPIESFHLGSSSLKFPRLLNGLWQLSSPAWGSGSAESQEAALALLVETGLGAADMADHYGDAELIYGDFRSRLPAEIQETVYAATKWCIFGPLGQPVTTEFVLDGVKERARRLGGRVDLLQFHWYDYSAKEYLDILVELVRATKTHPHLVAAIGLCNFDAEHTEEACRYILDKTSEVGLVSNQVQV